MSRFKIKGVAIVVLSVVCCVLVGCAPGTTEPVPGPDKQAVGTWYGAATGAGAGAVTGFNIASAAGPGALIGAGFGAVMGMFSGLGVDLIEDEQLYRRDQEMRIRELAWIQEVLMEHYNRRLDLHPSRDIFPADLFFEGDGVELRKESELLLREIARLTKGRMPWSRIVVAAYVTSSDPDSPYARHLTKRRADELAVGLVQAGVDSRRVYTRPQTLPEPILHDPDDNPDRYRQAIEIIAIDR